MTGLLQDIGFSHDLALLIAKAVGVIIVAAFAMLWTLIGIWIERKAAGRFQDRLGPNRVGPYGLGQNFADMVKLIIKEDIMNAGVDRWVYNLAPIFSVMSVILLWAVVPFSDAWIGTDLNIGVLYLIAVGAIGTIGIMMAGWGSNNKYSLLAAFRSVAQLISYEIPMVIALLIPVLMAGTMSTQGIIEQQYIAYAFAVPLTLIIFLISGQAETGRGPFDLLEAESEIVAGFHTEYSSMKFGMFMVTEFAHAFTVAVLATILFLGGWRIPFVPAEDTPELLGFFSLMAKSIIVYLALIWVRMTLPRLRIDHLLNFNWKFLVPLSLINLLVVAFVWKIIPNTDEINSAADALVPTLVLLLVNVGMIAGVGALLRDWGRRDRARIEARRARPEAPRAHAVEPEPASQAAGD